MTLRPVSDAGEQGRRIVVERTPTVVEGVVDYNRDEDGTLWLFGPKGKPAGDFGPGTVRAVYYADEAGPDPVARAG